MDVRIGFRFANYDTPLWVNPNRWGHRYNQPDEAPTQYLTLHPLGCVAEYIRGQDLRFEDALLGRLVRIWALKIDLQGAGVLEFDKAEGLGLLPHDLISDDYGPCQDWATQVRANADMPKVWIVPNAALPGTQSAVIFGPRVMSSFHLPPPDPTVDTPATIVGDYSSLPPYLLPDIRFKGQDHAGFDGWAHHTQYEFRDPDHYPV